jgi:hypothetical protein
MAEGFWEQAVETYLAVDRGLFLNPQYLVGEEKGWQANPDFLAICFPDSLVWMVEVTKAPSSKLSWKIANFRSEFIPRIHDQMTRHRVIRDEPAVSWSFGFWAFVPKASVEPTKNRMATASILRFEVTALEDTVFPPWSRFRP